MGLFRSAYCGGAENTRQAREAKTQQRFWSMVAKPVAAVWITVALPCVALAQDRDVPDIIQRQQASAAELADAKQQIQKEEAAAAKLRKQQQKLDDALALLQEQAGKVADEQSTLEAELERLETEQVALLDRRNVTKKRLNNNAEELEDVLRALQRLSMAPSEMLLILHENPAAAGRAGQLLSGLYKRHNDHVAELRRNLAELTSLRQQLKRTGVTLTSQRQALKEKQADLESITAKKQAVLRKNQQALQERQRAVLGLANQVDSIENLLSAIDDELRNLPKPSKFPLRQLYGPQRIVEFKPKQSKPERIKTASPFTGSSRGKFALPVVGKVTENYGDVVQGIAQKGLRFKTRRGSLVRSPGKGKVVYAGEFRAYGRIVIVDHGRHYHSVLGNLASVDVALGERLKAGDPIGKTGGNFYLELRHRGKPVNPSTQFRISGG